MGCRQIERLRHLSYDDLLALEGQREHRPMDTTDGRTLGLETQVFWDGRERQNLRVVVDASITSSAISRAVGGATSIAAPDGYGTGRWRPHLQDHPGTLGRGDP